MSTFDMQYLINKPTCFQSVKPNCIDLILTNKKRSFQKLECVRSWNIGSS